MVSEHGASDPRVFGSVLLGTDTEASHPDLLVEPDPRFTLFGVASIMTELQAPVDAATPGASPLKSRDKLLAEAQSI